jgi:peptidoglycan/LPS O-acetylase OafA/YrhL
MATTIDPAGGGAPVDTAEATEPAPEATARPGRMRHMPALDGMRGLFVIIGPLAYHFAPYWIPGGILGIDLFFVLSSFLIFSLALHEWDRSGRFDVGSYASRRVRRLFPALILCFVGTAFFTAFFLDTAQIPKWTGGITSAMSYVANWKEIFGGTSYFDASQYSNPQPFRHVWSFAIEEQFYLFVPIFLIVCMKWLNKKVMLAICVVGAVASAVWMAMVFDPSNAQTLSRAYYGTDTRAFALLLGIAMAIVCHWYGAPRTKWGHWVTQLMGLIATAVFLYLMFTTSEKTTWLFADGGFFLVAILAIFMTRAVSMPTGWLHWIYENKFLMWAGRIGFGLYLYHWLVYIAVDSDKSADHPGLNNPRDFILGFGLTFLIAWLSYKFIEKPFIKGRWPGWKLAAGLGGGIIIALSLLLYANAVRRPTSVPLNDATGGQVTPVAMGNGSQCISPPGSDPVKVLVVGDSVMVQMAQALRDWCAQNPGQIAIFSDAHIGCGTTRGGEKRYEEGPGSMGDVCATWADPVDPQVVADPEVVSWVTAVQAFQPDVVFSYGSSWDTIDRKVPAAGINDWEKPGDPAYDAYISSEYTQAIDILTAKGATLAWMISPHLDRTSPFNAPERTDRLNELVDPIVDGTPNHVYIDYPSYLGPTGGSKDKATRDDGVHIRADQLQTVADWLAPQLIAAGRSGQATATTVASGSN